MESITESLPTPPKFSAETLKEPRHLSLFDFRLDNITQSWDSFSERETDTAICGRYVEKRWHDLLYINQHRITEVLWLSHLLNIFQKQKGYAQLSQIYTKLLQCQNESADIDTRCSILDCIAEPLISYLDEMVAKQLVSSEVRQTAVELWGKLEKTSNFDLPDPDGSPGPGCGFMIAFDDGALHLEFEINKRDRVEAFFLNRDTDEMWEEDFDIHSDLSETLLEKIRLFRR